MLRQVSNRCFSYMHRDPIVFYTRLIEDLERIADATTIPPERLDPVLWCEIKEAKEELTRLTTRHADVNQDDGGLTLVPAIRKCYKCGKIITTTMTNGCKHMRTAITK